MLYVFLLSLIVTVISQFDCNPSPPSLFFGNWFTDRQNSQLLQIRFNTNVSCSNSYTTISQLSSIYKINCLSNPISFSKQITATYVQICSIKEDSGFKLGVNFQYKIYGYDGKSTPLPYSSSFKTRIYDPQSIDSFQTILLGDWSEIYTKKYDTLTAAFDFILKNMVKAQNQYPTLNNPLINSNIDALTIVGDIAYDLDSNNGRNYFDFMRMLHQISPYFPLLVIPGNHQRHSQLANSIMATTFQIYHLKELRHQIINFGNVGIVMFDPYQEIYQQSTPEKKLELLHSLNDDIKLLKAQKVSQIVVMSHYPLLCSQPQNHCLASIENIPQFFQMFNDENVSLYVGAHMHQYERLYPYLYGKFIIKNGSYVDFQGMVSVVEGCAPNQIGIVQIWYPKLYFSVTNTFNITGFGILSAVDNTRQSFLTYEHYKANSFEKPFDSFTIERTLKRNHLSEQ